MPFQACTILARNYLPHARVLYRSFRQFHPNTRFTALVFDSQPGTVDEPFDIAVLDDIGLPEGEETRMPMLYNVTELATALKPWFFRHLFTREQTPLLYFDPDIELFAPVDWLAQLASEHCLVVTPHTTRPMSRDNVKPNETDILGAGAYNLGFLGLNPDSSKFLDWWSERLLREALIDMRNMRFTDQRWIDFAPGYFDTCIVKEETCNVAYWNADSRAVKWTDAGYEVDGKPLCFFHFSAFNPEKPHLLSFHQGPNPRTRLSEHPAIARLCREYAEKLDAAGYEQLRRGRYGFSIMPNGLAITPPMRLAYRKALQQHEKLGKPAPPSPFSDPVAFVNWLNEPFDSRRSPEITRYFGAIHASEDHLQGTFPDFLGHDKTAYYEWLSRFGRKEIPIPNELFPDLSLGETTKTSPKEKSRPVRGVTVTGYLRAELGLGETARLMVASVAAAGEKYNTNVLSELSSRQNHPWEDDAKMVSLPYDTNLICINADQLPLFAQSVGPEFFENRYNVGLWFWETEVLPLWMHNGFNFVHEVWVTSEFVREALAAVSTIPIFTVPHPLNIPSLEAGPIAPPALNLPERFRFLFCFDFFSIAERKNPMGTIKAFQKAFAPDEGPVLVIKSINGHHNLAELERLRYARAGRSDIVIHDGYLTNAERDRLVAACDCYVSLHRSEGFGLTIAEAMLLEKPAIATRYGGNVGFMTEANSFLCGYKLKRIGPGCDPYPADGRWADPDIDEAAQLMRFVFEHPEEAQARAKRARIDLCSKHDPKITGRVIQHRLSELRETPPTPVAFMRQNPERPLMTRLRQMLEQGIDVRRTVPSLLTWIFQGPRRAMKQFLRIYDQHHRQIGIRALDIFKDVDGEWLREHDLLNRRISAQKVELDRLKADLEDLRRQTRPMQRPPGGDAGAGAENGAAEEAAESLTIPAEDRDDSAG